MRWHHLTNTDERRAWLGWKIMYKGEGDKGREKIRAVLTWVLITQRPGFPSVQGILSVVFSGAIFIDGGLWKNRKNKFIVLIFLIFWYFDIFVISVLVFYSFITTLKLVFEEEMDELTSPFCPLRVCEKKRKWNVAHNSLPGWYL